MIEKAINKILELADVAQFEIAGRKYTSKGIVPVKEPMPVVLEVHTLSGLVDYLSKDIDHLAKSKLFIHVCSPVKVGLRADFMDGFCERGEYIAANFEPPQIRCGSYNSLEDFIISLQAFFVPTETSRAILAIIGNLRDENITDFADDGITQAVTAKKGLSMRALVPVPNPVRLKPYRTFPEIDQPESLFVFRMRKQEGDAPACGLWEADNKQWKIEAVKGIAAWLQDKLPEIPIIA